MVSVWARGLNSLRALTNVYGSKGNNLNLKANIFDWQCINLNPEFLRAFWAHTLAFRRALLNLQGLRARGPFLFETLVIGAWAGIGTNAVSLQLASVCTVFINDNQALFSIHFHHNSFRNKVVPEQIRKIMKIFQILKNLRGRGQQSIFVEKSV